MKWSALVVRILALGVLVWPAAPAAADAGRSALRPCPYAGRSHPYSGPSRGQPYSGRHAAPRRYVPPPPPWGYMSPPPHYYGPGGWYEPPRRHVPRYRDGYGRPRRGYHY